MTYHWPAKTRISKDAQSFINFEFLYTFFVRKIFFKFVYDEAFNVVWTDAVKYSELMQTRPTMCQPLVCACAAYFYSKSGKWLWGWRTDVTSLFVHFMPSSRTYSWSGCTSGIVGMSAKCRTVPVNRNVCLRTLSRQGHSASFSSLSVNTFWRRQRFLLWWSHECRPTGTSCVQENVV
jgi:hypothetical protein